MQTRKDNFWIETSWKLEEADLTGTNKNFYDEIGLDIFEYAKTRTKGHFDQDEKERTSVMGFLLDHGADPNDDLHFNLYPGYTQRNPSERFRPWRIVVLSLYQTGKCRSREAIWTIRCYAP